MESYLSQHIEILKYKDEFFMEFWDQLKQIERNKYLKIINHIEKENDYKLEKLKRINSFQYNLIKRIFFIIPTVQFPYSKVSKEWINTIRNRQEQEDLYNFSNGILNDFCKQNRIKRSIIKGGIKPEGSIRRKIGRVVAKEDYADEGLLNLWDIVRYRFVVNNLFEIIQISVSLFQYFINSIVRCRNYYSIPQFYSVNNPYRAIHFEIEIRKNQFIEIQVMTKLREFLSFLDYFHYFKKIEGFQNDDHRMWLEKLLFQSNIYEFKKLEKQKTRRIKILPLTKNIVHLADSAKLKDESNK